MLETRLTLQVKTIVVMTLSSNFIESRDRHQVTVLFLCLHCETLLLLLLVIFDHRGAVIGAVHETFAASGKGLRRVAANALNTMCKGI